MKHIYVTTATAKRGTRVVARARHWIAATEHEAIGLATQDMQAAYARAGDWEDHQATAYAVPDADVREVADAMMPRCNASVPLLVPYGAHAPPADAGRAGTSDDAATVGPTAG